MLSESACAWALRYGFSAVAMNSQSAGGAGDADAVAVGIIRGKRRSAEFESKVSRSDFFADHKKWHRKWSTHPNLTEQWYVTPAGLIKISELPEGWGLLEANENGRLSVTKRALIRDISSEKFLKALMLCSRACSQKYLALRFCKWFNGSIELNPEKWKEIS